GVVAKEELISSVWPEVFVSDDVLPGCISALRKAFNDNARRPTVIETIHKSGYRLLLPVEWLNGHHAGKAIGAESPVGQKKSRPVATVVAFVIAIAVLLAGFSSLPSRRHYDSVAVLPFANATNDASSEYLSDGIAEQVVD